MHIVPVNKDDKNIPDSARCVAYWVEKVQGGMEGKMLFDPWSPVEGSMVVHDQRHTERVPHIHENFCHDILRDGKIPGFVGKTVFIFGRGPSLQHLQGELSERKAPAIFLNPTQDGPGFKAGDFVMMIDPRSTWCPPRSDVSLICTPGIPRAMIEGGWKDIFAANMRESSPINDWAKSLFPALPLVSECLSVAVSAIHYAAMCGAKNIVCCGMDFCYEGDQTEPGVQVFNGIVGLNGDVVSSKMHYIQVAMASAFMAMFAKAATGVRIINASGRGLFGVNVHLNDGALFDWVEQMSVPDALREFD